MSNRVGVGIGIAAVIGFILLYRDSVTLPLCGDDWMVVQPAWAIRITHDFWAGVIELFRFKLYGFFRPVALLPLFIAHHDLVANQVVKLIFVLLQAASVSFLMSALGGSRLTAILAGSVILLHQIAVAVYLQHDLWGDILGGFGLLAIALLSLKFSRGEISLSAYLFISTAACALTLGAKESGLAAVCIPGVTYLFFGTDRSTLRGHLRTTAAIGVIVILYIWYRFQLGFISNDDPSSYYHLSFGWNIPKNVILVMAGLLNPMNTVDVYLTGGWWRVAAAAWIALLVGIIVLACMRQGRDINRKLVGLFVLGIAALGPVILMPKVHEANVIRCLLFLVPAVALCAQTCYLKFNSMGKIVLATILILWLIADVSAVRAKVADLVFAAEQAQEFRAKMLALAPSLPSDSITVLVEWPEKRGYNLYRRPLYAELRYGEIEWGLSYIYEKPNLRTEMVLVGSLDSARTAGMTADFAVGIDGKPSVW